MRFFLLAFILLSITGCVQRSGEEPEIFQIVRSNKAAELSQLLARGEDPNQVNGRGEALLHVAAGPKGGAEVIVVLLKAGAAPNVANEKGRTALHIAASWCTTEIVELLLLGNSDPYILAEDGRSALDSVCKQPLDRRQEVVGILRDAMSN